jgi:hypothetical protein
MKRSAFIPVFLMLLITACKKDDVNTSLCYSNTLISQINSGKEAVHGITYNINCLVYESTQPFSYKKYSYDSENMLKKVEMAYSFNPFSCVMLPGQSDESDPRKARLSESDVFEYNDSSLLIRKSHYFLNSGISQPVSYQTFEYEKERIVRANTYNTQGDLTLYHVYTYDDNANVIRDDQYTVYSGVKLANSKRCEFDNQNNPYRVFECEGTPGINTNKNNIIKETIISYNGTSEFTNVKTFVYRYNSLGYPDKINDLNCIYGK